MPLIVQNKKILQKICAVKEVIDRALANVLGRLSLVVILDLT